MAIMFELSTTKQFRKSLKRLKNNKAVIDELNEVISILLSAKDVPVRYQDHELVGNMKGYRELHVRSDVLLIYEKQESILTLLLVNIGSHSELFK